MLYLIRVIFNVLLRGKMPCDHTFGELFPVGSSISQLDLHCFMVRRVELERICSKCGGTKRIKIRGRITHDSYQGAVAYGHYLIDETIKRSPKTLG